MAERPTLFGALRDVEPWSWANALPGWAVTTAQGEVMATPDEGSTPYLIQRRGNGWRCTLGGHIVAEDTRENLAALLLIRHLEVSDG